MTSIFDVTGFLTPLVNRLTNLIPDPAAAAAARVAATSEMLQFVEQQQSAQLAVDAAEANNKNLFVAGWRPFVGWVCGTAFAYEYIIQPAVVALSALTGHAIVIPAIDESGMLPVLMSMLGMGAMRSYEKVAGVAPKGAK